MSSRKRKSYESREEDDGPPNKRFKFDDIFSSDESSSGDGSSSNDDRSDSSNDSEQKCQIDSIMEVMFAFLS